MFVARPAIRWWPCYKTNYEQKTKDNDFLPGTDASPQNGGHFMTSWNRKLPVVLVWTIVDTGTFGLFKIERTAKKVNKM